VGLVFGALVLFFSSLSNEQGALTGTINTFFSQLLGWGAIAVPIAMLAAGIWLIIRHFGDEEPEIDLMRIFGVGMLYVGMLMIFMFIETFSELYQFATRETFHLFIAQSVELGRGGGRIGAELYTLLVAGLGEIPAMVMVIGWIFVALMLTTRTSAAELAVLIISIYRSFRVALQHRAQKRAALRLEQQARSAEQQRINVSGPQPAELPGGQSAALPASTSTEEAVPIEQRSIPIRMGGQMINAPVDAGEASAEAAPGAQTAEKGAAGGMIGGLASRLKSAVPAALPFRAGGDNGKEDHDDTTEGDSSPGGLRGLFTRRSSTSGTGEVPGSDEAAHRRGPLPEEQPTGEAQPAAPHSPFAAQTGAEERAAERYSRPASPFAPQRPRPQSPEEEDETPAAQHGAPDDAPPEERVFGSRPAPGSQQRGGTLFSQRFGQGPPERQADRVDDEIDDDDEAPAATERGSLSDRLERLNAIRFGKNQAPQTAASRDDDEDDDDDEEVAVSGSRPPSPFEEPPRTLGGQSRPRPTSPFARPDDRSRSEADDEDDDDKPADQPPARRADPGRPAAFRIPSAGASTPPKVPGPAPDDEEEHPAPRRREPVINRSAPQQPASMPGPQQGRVRRQWRLPDYRTLLASGSEGMTSTATSWCSAPASSRRRSPASARPAKWWRSTPAR
jgi:hypothetical protein